jgi:hypothetical protein
VDARSGRALRAANGRVVSMAGINLDVTARKQAEADFANRKTASVFFESAPAAVRCSIRHALSCGQPPVDA